MLPCKFCDEQFLNERSLGQHRASKHPDSGFPCNYCDQIFNNRQARYRHKCENQTTASRETTEDKQISSSDICCGLCNSFFPSMENLCSHLQKDHDEPADIREKNFKNTSEFIQWKKAAEQTGRFEFQTRSSRNGKNLKTEYLYCHRSGVGESISEGKRAPKKLGSVKTGFYCTAFAVVKTCKDGVNVKFCLDHYLHDDRLARLHLPNHVRQRVAEYYEDGRSASWIVDKLRSKQRNFTRNFWHCNF